MSSEVRRKSGRFEITKQTRASLLNMLAMCPADHGPHLFPSRGHTQPHLTTRQFARVGGTVAQSNLAASGVERENCAVRAKAPRETSC